MGSEGGGAGGSILLCREEGDAAGGEILKGAGSGKREGGGGDWGR